MKGSGIRKPNRARLGIVCITLAIANTGARRRLRRVIKMPSGKAIATAIAIETNTSQTCCPMCDRMSDQLALRNSIIDLSADYADFTDWDKSKQICLCVIGGICGLIS